MFKSFRLVLLFLLPLCSFSYAAAIQLKAAYDEKSNRVKLNWSKTDKNIREFTLQKSTDQFKWVDIAFQKVSDYNNTQVFQFYDEKPAKGKNYYRLKTMLASGTQIFSAVVNINAAPLTYNWLMYPVPVKDILTLQYKGTAPITGVINIFIQTMSGYIITRLRCASYNTTIPVTVSNLGKGVYDIRVIIEDEITWNDRFVK